MIGPRQPPTETGVPDGPFDALGAAEYPAGGAPER